MDKAYDPYVGEGSKAIPFFQFTTRLGRHILAAQVARELTTARYGTHHHVLVEHMETTPH